MELDVYKINGNRALPKGSKPPALEYQYLDDVGDPIDISVGVWTGQGRAEQLHTDSQPTGIGEGSVTIDVVTATATYSWADEDFATVGRFILIIWIGNGQDRFGSVIFEWEVADSPGADPSV